MLIKDQIPIRSGGPRTALIALAIAATCSGQPAGALEVSKSVTTPRLIVPVQSGGPAAAESPFEELNRALEEAKRKLDQLGGGTDVAALTSSLREDLTAVREENRRLRQRLEEVEDLKRQLAATDERLKERNAAAAAASDEVARLQRDLAASDKAREAAEDRLADMQAVARSALSEAADVGSSLVEMKERLAAQEAEMGAADEARRRAERSLAAARRETEDLESELTQVRLALDEQADETVRLEEKVATLERAAAQARDVARANLAAVESKIKMFDGLIADIRPAAWDGAGSGTAGADGKGAAGGAEPAAHRTANATQSRDLAALKDGPPPRRRPRTLAEAVVDLPLEKRVQARSLLADLEAETRQEGILMRVPGEELFALDSEKIETTAHDTLAKVAELISLFDDHEIEITGHTDALGDASYNQDLSERRAELVKHFFVEHYEVDDARFKVAGLGERDPITTNTTRQGRRANRRVEVLIRN